MKTTAIFAIALVAVVARAEEVRIGRPVMGTILDVTVVAEDRALARDLAEQAIATARHWDDVLTVWRPDGELAKLNAAAGGGRARIGGDLADALRRMLRGESATGGAFNPAVARLVRSWSRPAAPSPVEIRNLLPPRLSMALEVTRETATLAAGVELDSGAIGKGIALDHMARQLSEGGAESAFLNFGGSSQTAVRGKHGKKGSSWRVVVAGLAPDVVHCRVELRAGSLSTSRSGGVGRETGAIIDPRTGQPVSGPRSVTVIAADATAADLWSTALVVLGRRGLRLARRAGIEAFWEDERGITRTAGFPCRAPSRQKMRRAS